MPRDLNVPITDMKLVREQGYINGEWVDADTLPPPRSGSQPVCA